MIKIPTKKVLLSEIFEIDKKLIEPKSELFITLPFIGLENIKSNTREYTEEEGYNPPASSCFVFDERHVLYGKLRPYLNKVYLPEKQGKCSMEILPLLPKNGYTREFVATLMQSGIVMAIANKFSTGGRMPRANMDKILKMTVDLPADVSVCNELGLQIKVKMVTQKQMRDAAKQQEEAVNTIQSSILNKFFSYKKGDKLPNGWKWLPLNQAIRLKSGSTLSKSDERTDGDLPYIRVSDMNSDGNSEEVSSSATYVIKTDKFIKQIIPTNSVIFPKRGGAIATNKKRLVKKEILADSNIMAAICDKGVDVDYFFTWFQMIRLEELTSGSSVPQINNPDLYKLTIPVPIDMAEQRRLTHLLKNQLEKTKQTKDCVNKQLEAIVALPSAILREAFAFN